MITPCLRVFLLRHADGDFSFQTFFDDFLSRWLGCDTPEDCLFSNVLQLFLFLCGQFQYNMIN